MSTIFNIEGSFIERNVESKAPFYTFEGSIVEDNDGFFYGYCDGQGSSIGKDKCIFGMFPKDSYGNTGILLILLDNEFGYAGTVVYSRLLGEQNYHGCSVWRHLYVERSDGFIAQCEKDDAKVNLKRRPESDDEIRRIKKRFLELKLDVKENCLLTDREYVSKTVLDFCRNDPTI